MDPLALVLIAAAVVCAFCWVASLITKDTSWVDRIWSIVPVVYVWIFAAAALVDGANAMRLVVMAVLVTAWGARLTFNFARKGGYSGVEDYRWAVLRGRMKPWQFQLFNLFFIVLYQNALLVLISLPALIAWQNPAPFTGWDAAFAVLFAGFLFGEFVADQQQWRFHQAKRAAGGQLEPGIRDVRALRVQPPPQLLLRAGPVVGVLCARRHRGRGIRTRRVGWGDQLDDRRRGPAHPAVHRIDDLHRVDHRGEVPRLSGLPARDIDAHPAPPPSARGRGDRLSRRDPAPQPSRPPDSRR